MHRPTPAGYRCGFRTTSAFEILTNAGIALLWPSDVDPASDAMPKGNTGSVLDSGASAHTLRHVSIMLFMKQPYPVPAAALPQSVGSPSGPSAH